MEVHQPLSGDLLCSTCSQHYPSVEIYKEHYKSDYHRYNIKRKMVKLAPVTPEQFSTKLKENKNQPTTQFSCNQCKKTFGSANTLKQHAESKGHNPNMMTETQEKSPKIKTVFEKDSKRCLFCLKVSDNPEDNQSHMSSAHSFFIAQKEYCKNVSGLIEYLQEKIEVGNMCLTCENKGSKDFQSGDAVRRHMADRGHNFMKIDSGFEEYEKFYDFSSLFQEKLKEQSSIVPGIQFQKIKVIVDEQAAKIREEEDGSEEWEDQEEEEEGEGEGDWQDEEEEEEEHEIKEEGRKIKTKTYHIMKPTMTSNDELLLPNGKVLGHRKYRHIYRQTVRLPNYFAQHLKMLTNGEHNSTIATISERKQYFDMIRAEKLSLGEAKRGKKNWLRVGMTNNGLMKHFRCQNSL